MDLQASFVGMQIRPLVLLVPVLVKMPAATPTLVLSSNPVLVVMTLAKMLDILPLCEVHVKDHEHVLVPLPIKVTLVCLISLVTAQLSAKMQLPMEAQLVRLRTRASVNNRVTILLLIKELLER